MLRQRAILPIVCEYLKLFSLHNLFYFYYCTRECNKFRGRQKMEKMSFLAILIFSLLITVSCNKSSSDDDSDNGYIDPGVETPKAINANKAFTLNTVGICSASESCLAIIYQGKISGTSYVGIGVQNGSEKLKIYWQATSIPETTLSLSSCTVVYNGTTASEVTITNVTFSKHATNGTYTITFVDGFTAAGLTISSGNSITAVAI